MFNILDNLFLKKDSIQVRTKYILKNRLKEIRSYFKLLSLC